MKALYVNYPKCSETQLPYRNHGIRPVDLAVELNVSIQERNLVHAFKGQKLFC